MHVCRTTVVLYVGHSTSKNGAGSTVVWLQLSMYSLRCCSELYLLEAKFFYYVASLHILLVFDLLCSGALILLSEC